MQGWISLNRKIQNNWLWEDKPFSKGQAWIDILLLINHKDNKVLFREELIEVKRGERITSQVKLAKRWGWSRGKVKHFLNLLENDGMLIIKTDKRKTVLKVVNYNSYQENNLTKRQQNEQQTRNRHATDEQQTDINNKGNKENNENNKPSQPKWTDKDIEFKLSSQLYNHILNNNPKAKKPNLQTWATDIDRMIRIDGREIENIKKVIDWCQNDSFWYTNILSASKLRKQYDQLYMKMNKTKKENNKPINGRGGMKIVGL